MVTPDSMDEKLARLLGKDARRSSETLAEELEVSSATIRRRLRKLTRSRLLRVVGIVDASHFGFPLTVLLLLDVSHDKLLSAIEILTKLPDVQWVSSITGRSNIFAVAFFRSTADMSDFLTNTLSKMDGIRNSETFICLDVKKGRELPLI